MIAAHKQTNLYGEIWEFTYDESTEFRNIDGFLMTYKDQSIITVNAQLDEKLKQQGLSILRQRLTELPLGTNTVILWHRDDAEHSN